MEDKEKRKLVIYRMPLPEKLAFGYAALSFVLLPLWMLFSACKSGDIEFLIQSGLVLTAAILFACYLFFSEFRACIRLDLEKDKLLIFPGLLSMEKEEVTLHYVKSIRVVDEPNGQNFVLEIDYSGNIIRSKAFSGSLNIRAAIFFSYRRQRKRLTAFCAQANAILAERNKKDGYEGEIR